MKKSTLLTKIKALSHPEAVTIDGIDEPLYIRRISVAEQARLSTLADDPVNASVALIICGIGNEHNEPLFSDADKDTIKDLDAKIVGQLVDAITKVNFGKTVDDHQKN